MKLTAINVKTGKVLLSQSGGLSEENFRRTVSASFPGISPDDIVIVSDGTIKGGLGHFSAGVPNTKSRGVVWRGSFMDLGGYANMNREITLRLLHRGFSVKLDMLKTAPQVDNVTMGMLNALAAIRLQNENSCPLVVGFTPMPVQTRGRKVIFFTMMETQGVHAEFVERCNQYSSEVWVPCKFYLDAFKAAGIAKPMHLIPLGVNDKIYCPDAKEPSLRYEEMPSGKIVEQLPNKVRFISLFGWSYRKGADVLCKSFLKEFNDSEDACLVIYSRYMGGSGEPQKEFVRNKIREWYKQSGKTNPPTIYYCGDPIPIPDLPGIFAAADCFVFCSRGEGFGLPVIEAGACNIPVISAYNTAMTQYLDDDVAFLVQTDELATADEELTWITEYYRGQLFPKLGEKSIGEFGAHMRFVYEHPEEAAKKAEKFRERILREYTWDVVADRVAKRLTSI